MGLYYLQSRYYDPELCRFLNADAFVSTGQGELGNNMFGYCRNNPLIRTDISGTADYDCVDDSPLDDEDILHIGEGGGGSSLGVHSYYVSGATQYSNGGNGTGSMIGNSSYIGAKAANSTVIPSWSWADFLKFLFGNSSSKCFVAGTLVHTSEGTTAIENIHAGDLVWAWNEETGEASLKRVVETYINQTDELVHVFVEGEEIVTTPSHPFYSPVKGWTDAAQLRAGDILVLLNGEYVVVEQVQHEILESPIAVYNFQVEDFHTYYISWSGILVHNACRRGVGGKGWEGDKTWRDNVKTIQSGGTITELKGGVPTQSEATRLINHAGGNILRVEDGHLYPNPHTYPHINYVIGSLKGTLRILFIE